VTTVATGTAKRATRARLVYFDFWTDPVAPELLRRAPNIDLVELRYASPVESNWRSLAEAHGYQIAPRGELQSPWFGDEALLKRCPDLLAISSTGSGYDVVDVDACTRAGVLVCNQAGGNRRAVAEHALGLMISLSKKIALADRALREREVQRFEIAGNDVGGKTVGIVGLGHIGSTLARLCDAFGMEVLAYDPYLDEDVVAARCAKKVSLNELLARSDFVSVHCPRNAETLDMFGHDQFARMKRTAYFVNTARGGIHDEAALAAALGAGTIAGAGLDVFLVEPPAKDHPLLAFENVVATPHTAGVTAESLHNLAKFAATQWIDLFAGKVPPRLVNPDAWSRYAVRFEGIFGFRPAALAAAVA
jgi:D-3-phosphoglycerate dehydrogenase